jgi:hypothetical protein
MAKHQLPPVPPAGRTDKAPGEGEDRRVPDEDDGDTKASAENTETGGPKNVAVNTTGQGHQQRR